MIYNAQIHAKHQRVCRYVIVEAIIGWVYIPIHKISYPLSRFSCVFLCSLIIVNYLHLAFVNVMWFFVISKVQLIDLKRHLKYWKLLIEHIKMLLITNCLVPLISVWSRRILKDLLYYIKRLWFYWEPNSNQGYSTFTNNIYFTLINFHITKKTCQECLKPTLIVSLSDDLTTLSTAVFETRGKCSHIAKSGLILFCLYQ